MAGAARRMQPDRLADPVHGGKERIEPRPIERLAAHVGKDLHPDGVEVAHRPLRLAGAGVRLAHRDRSDEAGKAVGMSRHQRRHAVVGDRGELELERGVALAQHLERRHRQRQDLRVVGKAVDDAQPHVEIMQRGDRAHALADVAQVAGDLEHPVEERLWKEVIESIDPHTGPQPLPCRGPRPAGVRDFQPIATAAAIMPMILA